MNLDVEWATIGFQNLRPHEDFLQYKTAPPRNLVCGNTLQFRSLRNSHMLNISMSKSPIATKTSRLQISAKKRGSLGAAAAELALKAHALAFDPDMQAELPDGDRTMHKIAETVDLTEAPEDAVASLVIDLMRYCEREKIDWAKEVMWRAQGHLRREAAYEIR